MSVRALSLMRVLFIAPPPTIRQRETPQEYLHEYWMLMRGSTVLSRLRSSIIQQIRDGNRLRQANIFSRDMLSLSALAAVYFPHQSFLHICYCILYYYIYFQFISQFYAEKEAGSELKLSF